MSFFAFCSFFYHTGVRKRGISIKNILQLMLPRSSRGHMPVPLKRMLLGRRICPLPINTLEQCKCALLFAELIHRQVSTSGSHQRFNLHQGTCVCDMDIIYRSVLEIESEVPIFCQVQRYYAPLWARNAVVEIIDCRLALGGSIEFALWRDGGNWLNRINWHVRPDLCML